MQSFSDFGDVKHRGKWVPLPEWQSLMRREHEAKRDFERSLRIAVCIAGAIAIYWIIVPGLLNIWRG